MRVSAGTKVGDERQFSEDGLRATVRVEDTKTEGTMEYYTLKILAVHAQSRLMEDAAVGEVFTVSRNTAVSGVFGGMWALD